MFNGSPINFNVVYASSNNHNSQDGNLIVIPPPTTTTYNDQTGTSQLKRKRTRTAFTEAQIEQLENEFKKCMFLWKERRLEIAQRLGLQEKCVKIWFQNRRMKEKKATEQSILDEYQRIPSQEDRIPNGQVSSMQQLPVHRPLVAQLVPGSVEFRPPFRPQLIVQIPQAALASHFVPPSQYQYYKQLNETPVEQPTFQMPMNASIYQQPKMYAPELQAQQLMQPDVSFEEILELLSGPFGKDNVLISFDETAGKLISEVLDLEPTLNGPSDFDFDFAYLDN